ncbi:MAG: hypothetical protein KFF50_04760 [Desulfatitalea sp.]|nr:hypothetical protein [Desulfatitalea sp.]
MIAMDVPSSLSPGDSGGRDDTPHAAADPWRILLMELVHLLALFLTHARHTQKAGATAVFFNQIVHRLHILKRMPGHEGGLIIRRIGQAAATPIHKPDYVILFGDLAFRGGVVLDTPKAGSKRPSHLVRSLDQAFACLDEQGIHALYLQIPPKAPEKNDQLQLALNILARFSQAVENGGSITFRYFGRALTIPLIRDANGRPDPNLTLLAGLNGLSAVNMRQLIQQAEAFHRMAAIDDEGRPQDAYNTIFGVRSLRSQLIKPLVEVNNLPWMAPEDAGRAIERHLPEQSMRDEAPADGHAPAVDDDAPNAPLATEGADARDPLGLDFSAQYLALHLDSADPAVKDAMGVLFKVDFGQLEADGLVGYLGSVSQLLRGLERQLGDPLLMERVVGFLYGRLEQLPEALMTQMVVQRQGVKMTHAGRTLMVGMVHPRVLELIVLIQEAILTRQKMAAVDAWIAQGREGAPELLAAPFRASVSDIQTIVAALDGCFRDVGEFDLSGFDQRLDALSPFGQIVFEMLWCLLRRAINLRERLALLSALALLARRLEDLRRATGFLLSDLLSVPRFPTGAPYYAFRLINGMLHMRQKGRATNDGSSSPEGVLDESSGLDESLRRHVASRLDVDRVRLLAHFSAIRERLREHVRGSALVAPHDDMDPSTLLALEREGLVLMALTGGAAAREVLHGALNEYGDPDSAIYKHRMDSRFLADLMDHLRVVLKAMARAGRPEDLVRLKTLAQSASRLMTLDTDPAHKRRVKQALDLIAPAIRAIQVQVA